MNLLRLLTSMLALPSMLVLSLILSVPLHTRRTDRLPRNARLWQHGKCCAAPHPCDHTLRRIRQIGRRQLKQESGYHRHSLAEIEMFRFKTIFGDRVSAGAFDGQAAQLLVRTGALNQMTHPGMPQSYAT